MTKEDIAKAKETIETISQAVLPYTKLASKAVLDAFDTPLSLDVFTVDVGLRCKCNLIDAGPNIVEVVALALSYGYAMAMADQNK